MSEKKYTLNPEDYLKLYIYYQDRADDIKEAMFKTLTWTVGFAAAILGLIFSSLISFDSTKAFVPLSLLVKVSSGAGLAICLYSWFMLRESGKHISANWDRSKTFRDMVEGLSVLVGTQEQGQEEEKEDSDVDNQAQAKRKPSLIAWMSEIWNQLSIIVFLFAIAFIGTLVWAFFAI